MKLNFYSAALLIFASILVSCAGNNSNDYIDKSLIPEGSENTVIQNGDSINAINASNNTLINTPVIPGINPATPGVQTSPVNLVPQNANVQAGITAGNLNPAHGQPGHRCDIAVGAPLDSKPAPATVQTSTVSTAQAGQTITAPGMNPAHGEPGHRCDIAVGAPLNSKPPPATVVSTNPPPAANATTISTAQPGKTITAPGMNPAHGEPGHRCDIAVGAPLNSKPPPATVVSTNPPPATNATTISTTQPAAPQKTLPGMNPPHGEPGHRCDIAVGAPLNSKPVVPAAAPAQTVAIPPLLAPVKTDSTKN